ncbi:MAG: hypothetical protein RR734_04840 [Bacilli bacterium]
MRKLTYLAILEKCNDGYGVYFPDLIKTKIEINLVRKSNVTK